MPDVRFLLNVSRPRFWIYLFGPFIVGVAGAATNSSEILRPEILVYGLYFLFPANLLVYGVNDIFDFETDRLNAKKSDYEVLVSPDRRRELYLAIILSNLPFLVAGFLLSRWVSLAIAAFLFFSIFYSAPPIRAKSKPILDSIFNVLYVFPGIVGYQLIAASSPPISVIAAGGLWTMAMHAYSAIPDINADRDSGVSTVATFLGARKTLFFCLVLYLASAALVFNYLGAFSLIFAAIYTIMIAASFAAYKGNAVFSVYRLFPLVNTACGFLLFWYAVYVNFR